MTVIITAAPCTWCRQNGYFGDFSPGLYPLPCPNCGGIGIEGLISQATQAEMQKMRDPLYAKIRAQTDRLDVAGELFRTNLLIVTTKSEADLAKYRATHEELVDKFKKFPMEYLPVEADALKEGWERALQIVEVPYRPFVEKNSKLVVGKSYLENAGREVQDQYDRMG